MTSSLFYCPVCGAANAPDHNVCFACKQSLAFPLVENELQQRYRVLTQVGTGGFGAVYQALDIQAGNRRVAIKQINLRGLTSQEVIEATDGFNREVQMLSTLSHSHLPRIHTHFTDAEHWYVVMDFIDGETLERYLCDTSAQQENAIRTLALDEVLDIGLQLCRVLTYLHAHQPPIIFRDLKPSNIMRTPAGKLYLIDFGIARYFKPGQARDTSPLGSPGYAAPEQYGRMQTTPRSDIYSLGALLHHLLSRQDPSEQPFTFASLRFYTAAGPDLRELELLVLRMVEQDIEKRPADIAEIEFALLKIRSQKINEPQIWRPVPAGQTPPPVLLPGAYQYQAAQAQQSSASKAVSKKPSRRKLLAGSLAVAGTLALGSTLGGVAYWRSWHPSGLSLETGFPHQISLVSNDVSTIAWSQDGLHIAFGLTNGNVAGNALSGNDGFHITSSFTFSANAAAQPLNALAWSPDNTQLVTASQAGLLQIWDTRYQSGRVVSTGSGTIKVVAWSPDSRFIAFVDERGVAHLYNTLTDTISLLGEQNEVVVPALAWSPDSTSVAVVGESINTLQIWQISTGQLLTSQSNSILVRSLVWSSNGQYIAALGIDGTLQVWDSQNNYSQVFSNLIVTQQNQLAWSPNNRFLATIDNGNNLLLLDRSSGNTLVSVSLSDPLGRGGVFPGRALAWSADSQHIMIANSNMECWLWTLPWF